MIDDVLNDVKERGKKMRIEKEDSLLLVVDIQEKLFPHIENNAMLAKKIVMLIEGIKALDVSRMAARQYPRGLGNSIGEVQTYFDEYHDKMTFSCADDEALLDCLRKTGKKNIIITGIEAHICVLQTAIDLKALGFVPIVVVDAVGSRENSDYQIALKRMQHEGVILTTVEAVLFELCRQAGTDAFKTISRLVK